MEFTMQLRKPSPKTCIKYGNNSKSATRRRLRNCKHNERCVCKCLQLSAFEFPPIWTELRMKNQLCDGTVYCEDGREFKVHRAILSAVSSYFRALFTNSINGGSPEAFEANITAPSDIFAQILDFIYTGNCIVNGTNVRKLLKVADQYEVLSVVQLCCKYLLDELSPCNCLGILKFGNDYFCKDLIERGQRYIRNNFVKVATESIEYVFLTKNEVIELLSDDELNVNSEEIVFKAAIRWVENQPEECKADLIDLLKCVRFGNLCKFFVESFFKHPLIESQQICQEYLNTVMFEVETAAGRQNGTLCIGNINFRPRISYDVVFAIGGWTAGSPTNFVETYDVRANKWLLSSDTDSIPRAYHGMCTLNGIIYVIGGFDGSQYFNTMRRFDPVRRLWSECACMYYHRCYVSSVAVDNKIYAMGGFNGRSRMNTVERYDAAKNQWEIVAPMNKMRSDAGAAVLQGKIYIVGGFNGQEVMKSAEVYNVKTNQWSYLPHMSAARSGVALVALDNTLFAIGGFNGYTRLTTGEKFSLDSSSWWNEIAEMSIPRSNFATVVLDNRIYAIGGFDGSSTVNFVEYYDPECNVWFEVSPMNLNRSALSACVISNLPNAKEYSVLGRSQQEMGQGQGPNDQAMN